MFFYILVSCSTVKYGGVVVLLLVIATVDYLISID